MKNNLPLRFVPLGAVKVTDKASGAVAYLYNSNDPAYVRLGKKVPCVMLFIGKAQKPTWRYRFNTEQQRAAKIAEGFAAARGIVERQQAKAAERKGFVNPYKVGDLFSRSWGYDQTNVNYYEVVRSKGCYVWVREIKQEYVATGDMCGRTTPLPGSFSDKAEEKKCRAQAGKIKINNYDWAYFETPKMVAGVPTYGTNYTSSYA